MSETTQIITASTKKSMLPFKWKGQYWLYVAGAGVLTYGISYGIQQKRLLHKTCFKPASFVPNKLSVNQADINIKLKMKNKAHVGYAIKSQQYEMYINNSFVGTIENNNQIFIAPQSTTDVWLNIKFNPLHVANISWDTIKDLIVKGGDLRIKLKGKAKIKKGIFTFNYPLNESFTLKELLQPSEEPC